MSECELCGVETEGWRCVECEAEVVASERAEAERDDARERCLEQLEERP